MSFVEKLLLLAMVAQVALTVSILLLMGRERVPRVMSGEIKAADIAVERTAYPLKARLLSNNFDNQFQLPILLFVGALVALHLGTVSWVETMLAWVFVLLRFVHAAIHVTTNRLYPRFAAYTAGLVVLSIFWLWLFIRILSVPSI